MSGIPCLSYRRAIEIENLKSEERQQEETPKEEVTNVGGVPLPNARIETVQENLEKHSLNPNQVKEYCENLFKFNTIKVMRYERLFDLRT